MSGPVSSERNAEQCQRDAAPSGKVGRGGEKADDGVPLCLEGRWVDAGISQVFSVPATDGSRLS